jgi:hypothetical protein
MISLRREIFKLNLMKAKFNKTYLNIRRNFQLAQAEEKLSRDRKMKANFWKRTSKKKEHLPFGEKKVKKKHLSS